MTSNELVILGVSILNTWAMFHLGWRMGFKYGFTEARDVGLRTIQALAKENLLRPVILGGAGDKPTAPS